MRRILLWGAMAAAAALAALSVAGAFLGAARARDLFNSVPVSAFWVVLLAFLASSVLVSPSILRRPGSLAMHVGPILILGGAMLGSDRAHDLARRYLHSQEIPAGQIRLFPGQEEHDVFDWAGQPAGELPFRLHLNGLRLVYYPWELWTKTPSDTSPEGFDFSEIPWRVNEEFTIPLTTTRMKVLEYIDSARPIYPKGAAGVLRIEPQGGESVELAAQAGAETKLADPPVTVRIAKVFARLRIAGMGPGMQVMEAPDGPENPALQLDITDANGHVASRYVMQRGGMGPQVFAGAEFRYLPPPFSGVQSDPSSGVPAMRVQLQRKGGKSAELWLLVPAGMDKAGLVLEGPLGPTGEGAEDKTSLWLAKHNTPVKQYESDVSVLDGGREVARQVVSVNHPLSYGGYSFTQYSFDEKGLQYTVLGVKSDTGVHAVFIGMAVVSAGAIWFFWGRAVVAFLRRRPKPNGH